MEGQGPQALRERGTLQWMSPCSSHGHRRQARGPDPALPRRVGGAPLRPPHSENLRAVAAALLALPRPAPSPDDGQRRGECLSHASGCGAEGEPFHPEPGLGGAVVSLPGAAGDGPGSRWRGAGAYAAAAAGGAHPCGGAGGDAGVGWRGGPGGGLAVWQWATADGGPAIAGQGF